MFLLYNAAMIFSVISIVDKYAPLCAKSAVRYPAANTLSTADTIAADAAVSPNEYNNIIAADKIVAIGLALF